MIKPSIEERVLEYQHTLDPGLFSELYAELETIVMIKGAKYRHEPEVESRLNLTAYECFLNYDPRRNDNFEAYFRQYLNFAVKSASKARSDIERAEYPIDFEMLDEHDCFVSAESAANLLHFQDALGMSEDECDLVEKLAAGWRPVDIAQEYDCTGPNVAYRIRRLRDKYPDMIQYLH